MKPRLSDVWRWSGPLDRGAYLFWGIVLAGIKFNLDRLIAGLWFDRSWHIFDPETWALYLWQSPLKAMEQPYFLTLLIVSLPFLWVAAVLILTFQPLRLGIDGRIKPVSRPVGRVADVPDGGSVRWLARCRRVRAEFWRRES